MNEYEFLTSFNVASSLEVDRDRFLNDKKYKEEVVMEAKRLAMQSILDGQIDHQLGEIVEVVHDCAVDELMSEASY